MNVTVKSLKDKAKAAFSSVFNRPVAQKPVAAGDILKKHRIINLRDTQGF